MEHSRDIPQTHEHLLPLFSPLSLLPCPCYSESFSFAFFFLFLSQLLSSCISLPLWASVHFHISHHMPVPPPHSFSPHFFQLLIQCSIPFFGLRISVKLGLTIALHTALKSSTNIQCDSMHQISHLLTPQCVFSPSPIITHTFCMTIAYNQPIIHIRKTCVLCCLLQHCFICFR